MIPIRKPRWAIPESQVTPEPVYLNRRALLAQMGMGGLMASLIAARRAEAGVPGDAFAPTPLLSETYADAGRAVTPEKINTSFNNFYEFGTHKRIAAASEALETDGWTVKIDGLVEKPFEIGIEDLIAKMPIEERIYRHRCVEAWSMVAPWIGFPVSALVDLAKPLGSAKFMRFETFLDTDMAPGQLEFWYPWPYVEGITMAEAMNDLSFLVVGAYGKVLHKPMGAPIRLHLPWKYGFKSIKSLVKISFVEEQPLGFWEELQAREYGFWANVNPEIAHPRWSQATEEVIGTGERIPTVIFNGYGEEVAGLYTGMEAELGDRLWR